MWIVLNSRHDQEDADDAKDDTQGSIAEPTNEDDPPPHLGIHSCQIESPLEVSRVRSIEEVKGNADDNQPNDYHQGHTKGLLEE